MTQEQIAALEAERLRLFAIYERAQAEAERAAVDSVRASRALYEARLELEVQKLVEDRLEVERRRVGA